MILDIILFVAIIFVAYPTKPAGSFANATNNNDAKMYMQNIKHSPFNSASFSEKHYSEHIHDCGIYP